MKWYSLRVISGKEKVTKENILFESEAQNMNDFIDDIFVPFEKVIELRNNKKRDKLNDKKLYKLGWKVYKIWECQLTTKHLDKVQKKLFVT